MKFGIYGWLYVANAFIWVPDFVREVVFFAPKLAGIMVTIDFGSCFDPTFSLQVQWRCGTGSWVT